MVSNLARFFESAVNAPHKVLGRNLKPFSLLHYLWLEHVESPFVHTDKPISRADVELAVLICSCDSSNAIQARLKSSQSWVSRILAAWFRRKGNLKTDVASFLTYHEDYFCPPEYITKKDGTFYVENIPWLLNLATYIIRETGWSEETVWTMPLGKLFWYDASLRYLKSGEAHIVTDAERAAEEALTAGGAK
jgi:hypothetical protein